MTYLNNKHKITLKELKQIELNILSNVDDFCKENDINYFLLYGTLLGAVRHKGFIPWDDDIDIGLIREDYDRLIQLFNSSDKHPRYKLININNTKNYYCSFSKIIDTQTTLHEYSYKKSRNMADIGVYIDVFPLDNAPGDVQSAYKYHEKKILPSKMLLIAKYDFNINSKSIIKKTIKCFIKMLSFLFSRKFLIKKIDRLSSHYSRNDSTQYYVNYVSFPYGKKEIMKKNKFFPPKKLEFEGHYYKVPADYEYVLNKLYGDYMQLPPVKDRVTHHDFKAYYI